VTISQQHPITIPVVDRLGLTIDTSMVRRHFEELAQPSALGLDAVILCSLPTVAAKL